MSKAKTEYEILNERHVPYSADIHAGKVAIFVKIQNGFMAWGFAFGRDLAIDNAVKNALKVKNG